MKKRLIDSPKTFIREVAQGKFDKELETKNSFHRRIALGRYDGGLLSKIRDKEDLIQLLEALMPDTLKKDYDKYSDVIALLPKDKIAYFVEVFINMGFWSAIGGEALVNAYRGNGLSRFIKNLDSDQINEITNAGKKKRRSQFDTPTSPRELIIPPARKGSKKETAQRAFIDGKSVGQALELIKEKHGVEIKATTVRNWFSAWLRLAKAC